MLKKFDIARFKPMQIWTVYIFLKDILFMVFFLNIILIEKHMKKLHYGSNRFYFM